MEMIAPGEEDVRAEEIARQRFGQKEEVPQQHLHGPEESRRRSQPLELEEADPRRHRLGMEEENWRERFG